MHAALDAASWMAYGLSLLVEVAGVVLAVVHRNAHPRAARLAIVGLLCALGHDVLGIVVGKIYVALIVSESPHEVGFGHGYVVVELAEQLTYNLLGLVGAAGWTLVLIAVFATRDRPPAPATWDMEGAPRWNPSPAS